MRKMLLLGALAAMSTAAEAATTISFDNACNVYSIRVSQGLLAAKEIGNDCGSDYGLGRTATIRTQGKTAILSIQNPAVDHTQFMLVLTYPFVTGGTYRNYYTTDGTAVVPLFSGFYTVVEGGQPIPKGKGKHSLASLPNPRR